QISPPPLSFVKQQNTFPKSPQDGRSKKIAAARSVNHASSSQSCSSFLVGFSGLISTQQSMSGRKKSGRYHPLGSSNPSTSYCQRIPRASKKTAHLASSR